MEVCEERIGHRPTLHQPRQGDTHPRGSGTTVRDMILVYGARQSESALGKVTLVVGPIGQLEEADASTPQPT
jgi:hypothetical protein